MCFKIAVFHWGDRVHFFDIFIRFGSDDIDRIIDSHDASQTFVIIEHGDGVEIVTTNDVGDFFAVGLGVNARGVFIHDVRQFLVLFRENEIIQVDSSNEFTFVVADENGVDGFGFAANGPNRIDRRSDGLAFLELQILGRHDGARGIRFVFEDLVDVGPHVLVGGMEDLNGQISRHIANGIGQVIRRLFVNQLNEVFIG